MNAELWGERLTYSACLGMLLCLGEYLVLMASAFSTLISGLHSLAAEFSRLLESWRCFSVLTPLAFDLAIYCVSPISSRESHWPLWELWLASGTSPALQRMCLVSRHQKGEIFIKSVQRSINESKVARALYCERIKEICAPPCGVGGVGECGIWGQRVRCWGINFLSKTFDHREYDWLDKAYCNSPIMSHVLIWWNWEAKRKYKAMLWKCCVM